MKRALGVFASAIVGVMVTAGTALAGYPTSPEPTTVVQGTGGVGGDGGTAFTGGNISTAVIVVGVLAVIGVTALIVARLRTAQEA
jgi:hypothetical protein